MILVHTKGETGDFITVSLIGGNHVQFEYESGKGPQGVTVETAYRYRMMSCNYMHFTFSHLVNIEKLTFQC